VDDRGTTQPDGAVDTEGSKIMWSWADRMVKAVSDVTLGTVIVLVHVALADRNRRPSQPDVPPQRRIAN
jgi:hypothetical protein